MSDESIRDRVVARLNHIGGEPSGRTKTAAFPPFAKQGPPPPPGNGQNMPPGAPGTGMKRNIPSDHSFNPKALKPLSQTLWAASVALGHSLTAYRMISKLKSPEISPDGRMGGRGYVMEVRDMRQKLYDAAEALSAISDTMHDEINAPHWKPKLAQLDENTQEDVERFIEESQNILANPEEDAEEEMEAIEKENDGPFNKGKKKKGKPDKKDPGSEIPGGGGTQADEMQDVPSESMAGKREAAIKVAVAKTASIATFEELANWEENANSSLPDDGPGGPRVDNLEPEGGLGPGGSFNTDEWVEDQWDGAGRGDGGENYDYPNEWENAPAVTAASVPKPDEIEDWWEHMDPGSIRSITRQLKLTNPNFSRWDARDWERVTDYYVQVVEGDPRGYDRGRNIAVDLVARADKLSESLLPDHNHDDASGDAWDFGLGPGAKGEGAGGYENPAVDQNGKGVEGPSAKLPGSPVPLTDEALSPAVDQAINERHGDSVLPEDVAGPPARSDYYEGEKDNLVQGEGLLPGDNGGSWQSEDIPVDIDTGYVSEDATTPYVKYDYTTKQHRPEHEHGRPEEVPFAQDGEATR